uniref:Uncharacterized protein n=1 Tax=Arundo donax TaxID=35708 RepID=A0A0A9DXA5_ARUDO
MLPIWQTKPVINCTSSNEFFCDTPQLPIAVANRISQMQVLQF